MASDVVADPRSNVDEFAYQRDQHLDVLASMRRRTKRCGKQSNRWLSAETVNARRSRRHVERRFRRTRLDADRLAYEAACRSTNRFIQESRKKLYATKLVETEGDACS